MLRSIYMLLRFYYSDISNVCMCIYTSTHTQRDSKINLYLYTSILRLSNLPQRNTYFVNFLIAAMFICKSNTFIKNNVIINSN